MVSAVRTPDAKHEGHFDSISGNVIAGWACESGGKEPLKVLVYDGDEYVATGIANRFRADLEKAGKRGGYCAFSVELPLSLADGRPHRIHVRTQNGHELVGSPRDVQIESGYQGFIESIRGLELRGWAWDETRPNAPMTVEVLADDRLVMTVVADIYRQDLLQAGKGSGRHAFSVTLPSSLADGKSHQIHVRVQGASTALDGSPKTLKLLGEPPSLRTMHGQLVGVNGTNIEAWSMASANEAMDLFDGENFVARVPVTLRREVGNHVFRPQASQAIAIAIPPSLFDGQPHNLSLRSIHDGNALQGSVYFCADDYRWHQVCGHLADYDSVYWFAPLNSLEQAGGVAHQVTKLIGSLLPVHVVEPQLPLSEQDAHETPTDLPGVTRLGVAAGGVAAGLRQATQIIAHKRDKEYRRSLFLFDNPDLLVPYALVPAATRVQLDEGTDLPEVTQKVLEARTVINCEAGRWLHDRRNVRHVRFPGKRGLMLIPVAINPGLDLLALDAVTRAVAADMRVLIAGPVNGGVDGSLLTNFDRIIQQDHVRYVPGPWDNDWSTMLASADVAYFPLNGSTAMTLEVERTMVELLAFGVPVVTTLQPLSGSVAEVVNVAADANQALALIRNRAATNQERVNRLSAILLLDAMSSHLPRVERGETTLGLDLLVDGDISVLQEMCGK